MDIVIISEFCGDFSITDNGRFFYLAKMLASESYGNKVELVTSSFMHSLKMQRKRVVQELPFKIAFVKEPGYSKNVCLKRFYSHFIWGKNVIRYIKKRDKKPDVIYCAIPSLTGPNFIARYCEKEDIRFIIDVQDLWPESFKMAFNIPIISDIAFFPHKLLAAGIYRRADALCAVSKTYVKRGLKGNKKVHSGKAIYLGTELDSFDKYVSENESFFKEDNQIILAYVGTLGTSYDLPMVFKAVKALNDSRLRFIIIGDGPLEDKFRDEAKGLSVVFMGRMPYEKACGILKSADIVINPIVKRSVASIINKHADYAASGKPVINTQMSKEYRELVDNYEMGYNCDSVDEVVEALTKLINDEALRIRMGNNARICAERVFDRKKTYKEIISVIMGE